MSVDEQIQAGLKAFKRHYSEHGSNPLMWTSVEALMHPNTHTRIAQTEPFHAPLPLDGTLNTAKLSTLYGCSVVLNDTLPVNIVRFSYAGVITEIYLTMNAQTPESSTPTRLQVFVVQQAIGSWDRSYGGLLRRWGSPNIFSSVEKTVEFLRWNYTEYSNWHAAVPDPVQDEEDANTWWIELEVPEPGFMGAERGEDPTKALIRIQRHAIDGLMDQIRHKE